MRQNAAVAVVTMRNSDASMNPAPKATICVFSKDYLRFLMQDLLWFCEFSQDFVQWTDISVFYSHKRHRVFMELLKLSRKHFPKGDIYLPKINFPQNYLVIQGHKIWTVNSIMEEVISNNVMSFKAKALPELREDTEFIVKENETTSLLVTILVTYWLWKKLLLFCQCSLNYNLLLNIKISLSLSLLTTFSSIIFIISSL